MLMKRIHIIVVKVLQDDRQFHQGTSAHFKNPTVLKSPETSISVHDCFNVKDFYFLDHLRFGSTEEVCRFTITPTVMLGTDAEGLDRG
jgi:hypothetical protein